MQETSLTPHVKAYLSNRIPERVHSFPQKIWKSGMGSQAGSSDSLKDYFQSRCSSQVPAFSPTAFCLNQLAVLCLPPVGSGQLFSKETESGTFGEGAGTLERKLPHSSIKRAFSILHSLKISLVSDVAHTQSYQAAIPSGERAGGIVVIPRS